MSAMVPDGTTVVFTGTNYATTAFSDNFDPISISGFVRSKTVNDATPLDQAAETANKKIMGLRYDHTPLSITYFAGAADEDEIPINHNDVGTITITWPDAATLSGTGEVTSHDPGESVSGEPKIGTIEFTFNGTTGPTWG